VLVLVLTEPPPPEVSPLLLHRHFRDALAAGCKAGPLADLAGSLEVAP
jgi:hypothetical protein